MPVAALAGPDAPSTAPWPAWLGNLLGMCNFIVKAVSA